MSAWSEAHAQLVQVFHKDFDDVAHFVVLLAAVAEADGTISDEERDKLQASLEAVFDSTLAAHIVSHLVGEGRVTLREKGVDAALADAAAGLARHKILEQALVVALELAASDGVEEAERRVIRAAAGAGGLGDDAVKRLLG